jgi:hypothetical protein
MQIAQNSEAGRRRRRRGRGSGAARNEVAMNSSSPAHDASSVIFLCQFCVMPKLL